MRRFAPAAWLAALLSLTGCAASPEDPSTFRYEGSTDTVPWTGKAFDDGAAFTALMRARITELDVRLQDLRLRVDRAKAQAGLLFLRPERNVLLVPDEGANP